MTTVEIIRITMNSTTDHLCDQSKSPGDFSPGRKDNMIIKNTNTINNSR